MLPNATRAQEDHPPTRFGPKATDGVRYVRRYNGIQIDKGEEGEGRFMKGGGHVRKSGTNKRLSHLFSMNDKSGLMNNEPVRIDEQGTMNLSHLFSNQARVEKMHKGGGIFRIFGLAREGEGRFMKLAAW